MNPPELSTTSPEPIKIGEYQDHLHAEELDDLQIGEYGYKFRTLEGLMLPPYVTPSRYRLSRSLTTRPEDVCYCSFPKSGSTWLANILYLILHNGEAAEEQTLRSCLHWMESAWTYPRSREEVDGLPSPRIFKSHMPYAMALGGGPGQSACKYIYIARNPKDVCVSYFHFESGKAWSGHYHGPWEHWLGIFMAGKVQRGNWFDHVLSWWEHREADNLLFLKYEDLKRDFDGQLRAILSYLGRTLTDEVIQKIKAATRFSRMKEAPFSNHKEVADFENFFRKGEVGSWKDQFTVAQSEAFDRLYRERMAAQDLDFSFE
jgi:hypothetical protein